MKSLVIQKVQNGFLVTGDYQVGCYPENRRLFVYNNIKDLQEQLPKLFEADLEAPTPHLPENATPCCSP